MSQRLTVADIRDDEKYRICTALNVCPDDSRILSWLNEAEERMINQGRWWGTVPEVQFCVDDQGCFAFPREVASLERIAVNGNNIQIENGWFPYTRLLSKVPLCDSCSSCSGNGGGACCNAGHYQMTEKNGTMASFATTLGGANKILRTYLTDLADVGKKITYQSNDKNNIWTTEQVTLASPFADTTTIWGAGAPAGVVKEVTQGRVLVYEYDTVTGAEIQLADYQPGETKPMYRIGYIPGLKHMGCNGCCSTRKTLTGIASLQHVQLVSEGDWLLMQNVAAYKSAMIAVKAWEEGDVAKANYYFYGYQSSSSNIRGPLRVVNRGGTIPLLKAELRKMTSDRLNAYIYADETDRFPRQMRGFI